MTPSRDTNVRTLTLRIVHLYERNDHIRAKTGSTLLNQPLEHDWCQQEVATNRQVRAMFRLLHFRREPIEQCLHVFSTLAKLDERCHPWLSDCPNRQACDDAVHVL